MIEANIDDFICKEVLYEDVFPYNSLYPREHIYIKEYIHKIYNYCRIIEVPKIRGGYFYNIAIYSNIRHKNYDFIYSKTLRDTLEEALDIYPIFLKTYTICKLEYLVDIYSLNY